MAYDPFSGQQCVVMSMSDFLEIFWDFNNGNESRKMVSVERPLVYERDFLEVSPPFCAACMCRLYVSGLVNLYRWCYELEGCFEFRIKFSYVYLQMF